MIRGDIDITMEAWIANYKEAWNKGVKEGKIASVGVNFPDAVQGWFIPRYLQEGDAERGIKPMAPELKKVTDLPKFKELFKDPEEPDKGRFYNGILGWAAEVNNTNKLIAYDLLKDYTNFRPGTGAVLAAAIASNYERGKPFVAYYWGPTWVLGKYDLVMLEEAEYNEEDWANLAKDPANANPVAFPVLPVDIGVNTAFMEQAPTLIKFLKHYHTDNLMISRALAYMKDNKATAQQAADHFLKTHPDIWTQWVPADVADRVKASL